MALSQAVLRTTLDHRPELVLPVVREALSEIPSKGNALRLHLHPQDAALLRKHGSDLIQPEQIQLVEDVHIERGGCRVRNSSAEIDATLPARWRRALAALGRDHAWLSATNPPETEHDDTAD